MEQDKDSAAADTPSPTSLHRAGGGGPGNGPPPPLLADALHVAGNSVVAS
jgi:hypothetical protein